MDCIGIFMDEWTHSALFNPELALRQSFQVISESEGECPEEMMRRVTTIVRYSEPYAVVKYRDGYSELIVSKPQGDYQLLICADAPFYTGVKQ